MAFLDQEKVVLIEKKLTKDLSFLGKVYKSKKSEYQTININHSMVNDYLKNGWEEFTKPSANKTQLRKLKTHSRKFEDDIWCQFYELGYRNMNYDENFILPFSNNPGETKQIDVVAINDETAFLIECKSSENLKKAPSYKDEFELLGLRIDGFKKAIKQIYGRDIKVKYIFATRNLRIDSDSEDMRRFASTNSFHINNNTYSYINDLIKCYKNAAFYQFLGLVLKNELINTDKIEIPAIKGNMGNKTYYMFSIEPSLLLKMGFILHRTKVNESEFPTYQRLLVPKRLTGISKFIDDGGYFPNSIILNFSSKKHQIQFESASKTTDSKSCHGILKLPNSYGIAYIIDGQHRVYGYANSKYKCNNTIPVVAFDGMDTSEQLRIFMEINENQKAVSPSLRLDLEEDLYWDSERADSRIKALRSSIIKALANSQKSPLYDKISVGADKASLEFKPFSNALSVSGLLPSVKGNKYSDEAVLYSLYDVNNHDHHNEMINCKNRIVHLLNSCYELVEQDYPDVYKADKSFILSNRGTYAFICLIGSLNEFLIQSNILEKNSDSLTRFSELKKYIKSLLHYLNSEITQEEKDKQLSLLGAGADTKWLRFFQSIINKKHKEYYPSVLIDWNERQDEELQDKGRKLGVSIEKKMKGIVLNKMKQLFEDNWELEINSIKRECQSRAEQEMEKRYKEGLSKESIEWTEMFNINDYKTIIEKYWAKTPDSNNSIDFKTFEKEFTIDIGDGIGSKTKSLKWISFFNSYRNLWAHEGTKEKRLNRDEVNFIEDIYNHFYKQ